EKGTTPLHVAAKAGQVSQAELLVVYGADPGAEDSQGKTPIDYARLQNGHKDLGDRLVECMYELTDRLAYYLCSRKPDHQNGQHYIVPEMSDTLELTEFTKITEVQLLTLPNHLFEELAMDVYDEVDRRETESIWLSTLKSSTTLAPERCTVPFLPVNPEFSSTRNQGRQKLARFNAREFATLIIDILSDAKRRQSPTVSLLQASEFKGVQNSKVAGNPQKNLQAVRKSEVSDDEPLYDSVASDEDYIAAEQMAILAQQAANAKFEENKGKPNENGVVSSIEEDIKKQLAASESEMGDLRSEIQILQNAVQNLVRENSELRNIIQHAGLSLSHPSTSSLGSTQLPNGHDAETELVVDVKSYRGSSQRPASMYEPREGLIRSGKTRNEMLCSDGLTNASNSLPSIEKVKYHANQVTKGIQELWTTMQDLKRRDSFVPCAERIRTAVVELSAIFPQSPSDEMIRQTLRQMNSNSLRLQSECAGLQRSAGEGVQLTEQDYFRQQVRICAYEIAKATKQLVTIFQY
ncbi:hypothetical protein L9F63_012266, partial [Diploptera punctata]